MKAKRDVLEDQMQEYEEQVRGLKAYIKELRDQTDRHGTEKSEFESDLIEAEHNIKFYEAEIARLKKELSGMPGGKYYQAGTMWPRTARQGIGFFVSSAIGFIAGVFLGSQLIKPESKDRREEGGGEP